VPQRTRPPPTPSCRSTVRTVVYNTNYLYYPYLYCQIMFFLALSKNRPKFLTYTLAAQLIILLLATPPPPPHSCLHGTFSDQGALQGSLIHEIINNASLFSSGPSRSAQYLLVLFHASQTPPKIPETPNTGDLTTGIVRSLQQGNSQHDAEEICWLLFHHEDISHVSPTNLILKPCGLVFNFHG
jgi:hypothetical protein